MQTVLEEKKRRAREFFNLVEKELVTGGDKYALSPGKEATDLICEVLPGRTGVDPIMSNILKYIFRFVNEERESDIVKMGAYLSIVWSKKFGSKEHKPDNPKPKRRRPENKKAETAGTDVPHAGAEGENAGTPAKAG